MRYVIIGAGAIGGTLGGRLAQFSRAHSPLLIARGPNADAMQKRGLRLRTPDEDVVVMVEVAVQPQEVRLSADDVLVVSTKTQQVEAALLQWVDQPVFAGSRAVGTAGDVLPVFTALNGVASERIALRYFDRVYGVCVWVPAIHMTPGEVAVRIGPTSGMFIIGRYAATPDEGDRALLATVASDWQKSGFVIHMVDDVMRWKHAKLLRNLNKCPAGAPRTRYRVLCRPPRVAAGRGKERLPPCRHLLGQSR